jgi:hypothetical protein
MPKIFEQSILFLFSDQNYVQIYHFPVRATFPHLLSA